MSDKHNNALVVGHGFVTTRRHSPVKVRTATRRLVARRWLCCPVIAALVIAIWSPVAANARQAPVARPDFSGHWVVDPTAEVPKPTTAQDPTRPNARGVRHPPGPGFGRVFTARQSGTVLVIDNSESGSVLRMTIHLDGSESPDKIRNVDIVSRATWQGTTLVIVTRGKDVDWGTPTEVKRVLRFDDARSLSVATTTAAGFSTAIYRRSDGDHRPDRVVGQPGASRASSETHSEPR
jgi:hypothetical protein